MNSARTPAGIARLRLEIEALERQDREEGPDRIRALVMDGKRRTLALLERTHADLQNAQNRARAPRTLNRGVDTSSVPERDDAPAAPQRSPVSPRPTP